MKLLCLMILVFTTFPATQAFSLPSLSSLINFAYGSSSDSSLSRASNRQTSTPSFCKVRRMEEAAGCGCYMFDEMNALRNANWKLCVDIFKKNPAEVKEMCMRKYYNASEDKVMRHPLVYQLSLMNASCISSYPIPSFTPFPAANSSPFPCRGCGSSRSARLVRSGSGLVRPLETSGEIFAGETSAGGSLEISSANRVSIAEAQTYHCLVMYRILGWRNGNVVYRRCKAANRYK